MKKKLVILTGAGISAESGIKTFRDSGGLWEGHNVEDVATPQGWHKNPTLVLDFYNKRRQELKTVKPNEAHLILADLENDFDIQIITQNVDNLHERAGSKNVLHLHGELLKVRSTKNENYILDWSENLHLGDFDDKKNQLRPHIVWFGEDVPALEYAVELVQLADILIIIGTSLQVYPAASLMHFAAEDCLVYYIDPNPANVSNTPQNFKIIEALASKGMQILQKELKKQQ
ncbi:SIR2 family NAD-dependent protein deacylase [Flavobacterium psychrophilum]|uniref:SIR2 family NAD-dependent protein deacylase n=1 Tax=Flavobacterium psychrophilum TaxID=96345 RepID=UPI000B7C1256|nr:NAD-dependent deacylase [Flavobacterium psychrophilum]MCB5983580.1 NAD-dependent deacylase [Flavobacterium psychrophilum]MCB5993559.1 NAD-dependent deacylase [Flavobacterium psychrophilum]MCB5995744.1 NAD-dependent deacylase [Flavobacterium psychrophilum]MCB6003809.1 NAD-dependent deacylase [Flavobacterium psychrophilum]MCB6005890.1 NAD-dependent deacylase [Flavobacterium psychrophilum]